MRRTSSRTRPETRPAAGGPARPQRGKRRVSRPRPLFPLGCIVATRGALEALGASGESAMRFVLRHVRGDWGELGRDDQAANDAAVLEGSRILSAYRTARGTRLWIITEADRSATTLLLPDEY